jgi:hypothetical protein
MVKLEAVIQRKTVYFTCLTSMHPDNYRMFHWGSGRTVDIGISTRRKTKMRKFDKSYTVTECTPIVCVKLDALRADHFVKNGDATVKMIEPIVRAWRKNSKNPKELRLLSPTVVAGGEARMWIAVETGTANGVALCVAEPFHDGYLFSAYMQVDVSLKGTTSAAVDYTLHRARMQLEAEGITRVSYGMTARKNCEFSISRQTYFETNVLNVCSRVANAIYSQSNLYNKKRNWEGCNDVENNDVKNNDEYMMCMPYDDLSVLRYLWGMLLLTWWSNGISMQYRTGRNIRPKIALVVGAGYSGVAEALRLQRRGYRLLIVDAQDRVGGCWVSRANKWSSTEIGSGFYLYPFLKWYAWQTYAYWLREANASDVTKTLEQAYDGHLRLETQVISCVKDDDRFRVRFQVKSGMQREGYFDHVSLCTGVYEAERMPHWADKVTVPMFTAAAGKMGMPNAAKYGTVAVIGNGSFATEALDQICQYWCVDKVLLIARQRKFIMPSQWRNMCYLLVVAPVPWSWKLAAIRWLLPRKNRIRSLIPRNVTELKCWYTGTASRFLYRDRRVTVHIAADIDAQDNEVRVGEQTIKVDAIILALGTNTPLTLCSDASFTADTANGMLGVWAVGAGMNRKQADINTIPARTVDKMWEKAATAWRHTVFVDKVNITTTVLFAFPFILVGAVLEACNALFQYARTSKSQAIRHKQL